MKEQIRLSFLLHRGNILAISEETGYPLEVVRKEVDKIKKHTKRDMTFLAAQGILNHVILGHKSRVLHLHKSLELLEGKEKVILTGCCRVPVIEKKIRRKVTNYCFNCKKECIAILQDKLSVYDVRNKLIESLREEDKALVDFAKRLGFINPDAPLPPLVRNEVMVLQNQQTPSKPDGLNQDTIALIQNLPPIDREKIRKQLELFIKGELKEPPKLERIANESNRTEDNGLSE